MPITSLYKEDGKWGRKTHHIDDDNIYIIIPGLFYLLYFCLALHEKFLVDILDMRIICSRPIQKNQNSCISLSIGTSDLIFN